MHSPWILLSVLAVASTSVSASFESLRQAATVQRASASQTPSECVSIASTSLCAPFAAGLFVNLTQVSSHYALPLISASEWEQALRGSTTGGRSGQIYFQDQFGCSGMGEAPVQYHLTYSCLRDVVAFSAGCNDVMGAKVPTPLLCESACTAYSSRLNDLLNDVRACPPVPSSDTFWSQNRNAAESPDSATQCLTLFRDWAAELPGATCVNSVNADADSCGFSGNLEAATSYCAQTNPTPACCTRIKKPKKSSDKVRVKVEVIDARPANPPMDDFSRPDSVHDASARINAFMQEYAQNRKASRLRQSFKPIKADGGPGSPAPTQDTPTGAGLSAGAIVGIVISVLVALGLAGVVFVMHRKGLLRERLLRVRNRGSVKEHAGIHIVMTGGNGGASGYARLNDTSIYTSTTSASASQNVMVKSSPAKSVIVEYVSAQADELTLRIGDVVTIEESFDDGWCKMTVVKTGVSGMAPAACVGL
ncbi:hypothetical protein BC830DRAFT_1229281 [Chytriomyces sp. MP71]|nr:hypothetical protein BC830DRAFT_1229281 [Chytriomyces sp. MP71]